MQMAHATRIVTCVALVLLCASCGGEAPPPRSSSEADAHGFTAPTDKTAADNAEVARTLDLAETVDFEEAKRGLVASDPNLEVVAKDGRRIWDPKTFDFVKGDAPPSVNPSLWRQAKLNGLHGLFEVTKDVYQVRGYDVSNMTLIRGKTGWIVVDPLTSEETASAALAFARKHLGNDPVSAIIVTHSHVDHFAGIRSILSDEERAKGEVRIIAPEGFVDEATSENVLAGTTMARRAMYQFGLNLPRGPRAYVDTGLGKAPARGTMGLHLPTDVVDHTPQPMEIDGVRFVFQNAPASEAPAELTFYLPTHKAYCGAEIVNRTMHNLYTLRGAKVRDALRWSGYIDDALYRFDDAEIVFGSHTWPVFGKERTRAFLKGQRDTYKYIHDQTMRLASQGYTSREIAEQIELPPKLAASFANRGYYGTVRHNSKAVYQFYFGWYDGNPANLDPLPPEEEAKKYVEAMGGSAEVKRKVREAFERGEYRWAATLGNQLVFANAEDGEARELLAGTYDQLGYRAESGVWRSVYLTGAQELRHGVQGEPISPAAALGIVRHLPIEEFLNAMATRVNGPEAAEESVAINLVFTDTGETHVLTLENGVLNHAQREANPDAAATVKLTRALFLRMAMGQAGLRELIFSDELSVEGSRMSLLSFFSNFDPMGEGLFPIVTP
jgi:alkyl sulfatase BDS1-like metallo-beta-lactamase superfamily hydrolase